MAHGESVFDASDEICDPYLCSPCRKKNKNIEGHLFCKTCQDYYCSQCVTFHQDYPALSSHVIIEKSDPKFRLIGSTLKCVPLEQCGQHYNTVDMYCISHKKVGCYICMAMEHESCTSIQYIPEHFEGLMKSVDLKKFKEDCTNVEQAAKERIQVHAGNIIMLQDKKKMALKTLKTFKKEVVAWLDEIERRAIEHLDADCVAIERKWTAANTDLEKLIEDIERYVTKMNFAVHNQSQQFVCASLCQDILSSADKQTQTILPEVTDIIFTSCAELQAVVKSHEFLGTSAIEFNRSQLYKSLKTVGKVPTNNKELADLMFVGARVMPGKDWNIPEEETTSAMDWKNLMVDLKHLNFQEVKKYLKYLERLDPRETVERDEELARVKTIARKDRFLPQVTGTLDTASLIGTVVAASPHTATGWLEIKWDNGGRCTYKMGFDGKYELTFAE